MITNPYDPTITLEQQTKAPSVTTQASFARLLSYDAVVGRQVDPGHSAPASTSALGNLFGFIYPSIVQLVRKFKRIIEVNSNVQHSTRRLWMMVCTRWVG